MKRIITLIVVGVLLLTGIIFGCNSCATVPTGHTGIVTTFGKVEDFTFASGLHLKSPFQRVINVDNRTQKVEIQTQAFSKDIQQVDVVASVNYCIDQTTAQTLYRTIGVNYYENVIYPRILEDTKSVFTGYSAADLVANRSDLSGLIFEKLSADVSEYGIQIISVNVENIDFTDAYTNAVEAKQVAEQDKLQAQTKQAQLILEKEAEAKRKVIDATAAQEIAKLNADAALYTAQQKADAELYAATQEAAGNKALQATLTAELIKYQQILRWDGKLPTFIGGGSNTYPVLTFE